MFPVGEVKPVRFVTVSSALGVSPSPESVDVVAGLDVVAVLPAVAVAVLDVAVSVTTTVSSALPHPDTTIAATAIASRLTRPVRDTAGRLSARRGTQSW